VIAYRIGQCSNCGYSKARHDYCEVCADGDPLHAETLAEIERLRARVASLEESLHYANGTADLAMKHRDDAEKRVAELERALLLIEPSGDFSGWEDKHGRDIGNSINAALAKDGA